MATIRFVGSLIVQSQPVFVPASLAGEPECRVDPAACCPGSGGGTGGGGCCYPRPPERLWASLYGESAACLCLDTCVALDYSPPDDAWYSTDPIAEFCVTGVWFLRLKCVDGSYRLDVVGEDHAVVLEGTPAFDFSCDPFLVAACFDDPDALVCPTPGQFCYFIVESECTPGSGSGGGSGGGGTTLGCSACPDGAPLEWAVPASGFTGACAAFGGGWTLSYEGAGCAWSADSGTVRVTLGFSAGVWTLTFFDSATGKGATYRGAGGCCAPATLGLADSDCPSPPASAAIAPVGDCGGGGGGGGGLAVDCCADDPVSAALYAVFSEGTGDLVCLDGVGVPLSGIQGSPGVAQWGGTLPASCGLPDATLNLNCTGPGAGGWSMGCAPYGILGTLSSVSCLPFRLVFTTTASFAGSGTVKVTVTPA